MDPIEKAIRAALEKGNPEDSGFRQKIYRSAESALARSLAAREGMDQAAINARMSRLSTIVASIETEFMPADVPDVQPASTSSPATSAQTRVEPARVEPDWTVRADGRPSNVTPPREPVTPTPKPATAPVAVEERRSRRQSSALFRRLAGLFVVVTLLALIVMLGWAVWSSSLFNNSSASADGPAKLNPGGDSSGQITTSGTNPAANEENWISVFEPKDAASVEVSDGLSAELVGEGRNSHLKIIESKDAKNGQANFEIGRGLLETLRGKKVVFNVQANTTDGAYTHIGVSCSLAGMGECKRVRFRLDGQRTENLVIVQLADLAPEASGTLTIVPDIDKSGKPVEIVAIRVRAEQ